MADGAAASRRDAPPSPRARCVHLQYRDGRLRAGRAMGLRPVSDLGLCCHHGHRATCSSDGARRHGGHHYIEHSPRGMCRKRPLARRTRAFEGLLRWRRAALWPSARCHHLQYRSSRHSRRTSAVGARDQFPTCHTVAWLAGGSRCLQRRFGRLWTSPTLARCVEIVVCRHTDRRLGARSCRLQCWDHCVRERGAVAMGPEHSWRHALQRFAA
mmetsp:Transcript_20695/g.57774  ORF Transcript_20695/g.57774 Transcript_20695/m.57774 type:complete len:213 (-) Transcript_20695:1058-1696(-)